MRAQTAEEIQVALAVIAAGGLLLYALNFRPGRDAISRTVIPVDEPTMFDWAEAGGQMFFL